MERITTLFPVWALLFSACAYLAPAGFVPLKPAIVPLLGLVMFGMGMTLTLESFAGVLRRPGAVLLGATLQYLLMPLVAWGISRAFGLAPPVAAGLVLVGSCPGGTASNVVCYLARGDVALSITLTAVSTVLAVFATPLLTWLYVGRSVPVPVGDMLLSILKIVVLPVVLGVGVNTWIGSRVERFTSLFPVVSVGTICLIIAIIVALNHHRLQALAGPVALAVILHNLLGLAGGYGIPRALGMDAERCRTLAIEVGMQNSGLGVALAVRYFPPTAALPGAVFSIWHNLSGSCLAGWWARRDAGAGRGERGAPRLGSRGAR